MRQAKTTDGPALSRIAGCIVLLGALAAIAIPGRAQALEFACEVAGDRRWLRVELPGEEHLCEVSVTDLTGARRVMWYADNDSLFCSAKARELRDKYTDKWGFECADWPDTNGVDALSASQRRALDLDLKALMPDNGPRVDGVRVISRPLDQSGDNDRAHLLALRFFLVNENGERSDQVRLVMDDGQASDESVADWHLLGTLDSLASHVEPLAGERIQSAWIEAIGSDGALEIRTVVADGTRARAPSDRPVCRGRQTLAVVTSDGSTAARTPHRWFCEHELASE